MMHILKLIPLWALMVWNKTLAVDIQASAKLLQLEFSKNQIQPENVDLLQKYFEKAFQSEINQFSESNKNASSQCISQLRKIFTASQNGDLWALKFLDSWGKVPSGILWGHLVELGNFDECLSIEHALASNGTADFIQGQYCMASLPLFKNISEELTQSANIKLGVCVPRTCDQAFLNMIINQTLSNLLKVALKTDIIKQQCIKSKSSDFELIDWIAVSFFSFIGLLVALSTIWDWICKIRESTPNHLKLAFSLRVNMGYLLRTTSKKSPNIISCLNGIRCMSIIWIIFGHGYLMAMFLPNINTVEIVEWAQTPFSMILQSGTISVDSFFFLSGLLLVWACMKEMEKKKGELNVFQMYLHRYLRLTPVVAAAMLFFVSLYRHMGNGPLWDGFTSTYKLCHETWWATLLYVQNYAAAGRMCVGHSWYLAVDMQLYILSPLILIPIYKWKMKAIAGVIILALLLVTCVFTSIVVNNFAVFSRTGNLGADTQEMRKIYYATHARASPWLIGIIFGYFLYNQRNSRTEIRKSFIFGGWLLSLALLAAGLFSLYSKTLPEAKPLTIVEGAFYLSLSRVAWPLALSWIVFACVNGYGGFINAFLSWTFWQPMARLSYCMYIFHLIVETIHAGRTKVNVHFSDYDMIYRFWGDFGITILVSMVMYLMFESPIIALEKSLFDTKKRKSIHNATISNQNLCDNET